MRGGSGLGRALGLSPLVVGLTVVAFATSAPELAVSIGATFSGAAGLAVMVVAALALAPGGFHRGSITRWEATGSLAYYAAYITYLLLAAAEHDALPVLSSVLLWFLLPMTTLILAVLSVGTPVGPVLHVAAKCVMGVDRLPEVIGSRSSRQGSVWNSSTVPVAT